MWVEKLPQRLDLDFYQSLEELVPEAEEHASDGDRADRTPHPDALVKNTPFQLRRIGIETKLVLGNTPPEVDLPLIRNIVKTMEWYDAVKSGKSFVQIATQAGVKTDRVRSVMNLAFLAPNIIEQVISGTLPLHMTSDFLIRTGVPSDWNAQRELLENVGTRSVR